MLKIVLTETHDQETRKTEGVENTSQKKKSKIPIDNGNSMVLWKITMRKVYFS